MIYAAAMPIEKYVVDIGGTIVGLYEEYKHDPDLLALIMIATPHPFGYELNIPVEKHIKSHKDEETLKRTLDYPLSGTAIRKHLRGLNPLEFCNLMIQSDISEVENLPICEGISPEGLCRFVAIRAAAWAVNFRGKQSTHGNVHVVMFRGVDIPPEFKEAYESFCKEYQRW